MNAISHIVAGSMPKISRVRATEKLCVEVEWIDGLRPRTTEKVDLAPLINSIRFYKALRKNQTLFETVHLIDDGEAIAWGEDDSIDMPTTSVERLAEEMMTSHDLEVWVATLDYTHNTTAAMLGYSRRQIENFLSGAKPIPRVCVLACKYLYQRRMTQHYSAFASTGHTVMYRMTSGRQGLTGPQVLAPLEARTIYYDAFASAPAVIQPTAMTYDAP